MLLFQEQARITETDRETEKTQQNTYRMPLSSAHKAADIAKLLLLNTRLRPIHSLIHCGLRN